MSDNAPGRSARIRFTFARANLPGQELGLKRMWRVVFVDGLDGTAEVNALLARGYALMREYPIPTGVVFVLFVSGK